MQRIMDILDRIDTKILYNGEKLYNLMGFYKKILELPEKKIISNDCSLMPYYVVENKRMELYEFELVIRNSNAMDHERRLLKKRGNQE